MVEDREVEFLVFSREIVGCHALGDKMTEVSPIPGNKVLLGICFWREGLEGAFEPERRG